MTIHKKLLFFSCFILSLSNSFSQSVFVKIIDFETGNPVSDLKISNIQNDELIGLSERGTFYYNSKKLWNGAVYTLKVEKKGWEILNEIDLLIQQDTLLLTMVNSKAFTLNRVKLGDSLGAYAYKIYEKSLLNIDLNDPMLSNGIAFAKFRNIHQKMTEQLAGFNHWKSSRGIRKVFEFLREGKVGMAIDFFNQLTAEQSAGYLILQTYFTILNQNYNQIEIDESLVPILNQNDLIAQKEALQLVRVLELKLNPSVFKLIENRDISFLNQILLDMDEKCFCGNEFESTTKAKKMISRLSKGYEQLNRSTAGLFFQERIELAILNAKFSSYTNNNVGFEKNLDIAYELANELRKTESFRYYEIFRNVLIYETDSKLAFGRNSPNGDFAKLNNTGLRFFKQNYAFLINQELTLQALLFNLKNLNSDNSKGATYELELEYWKEKVIQKYPRAYNLNSLNELKNQILHAIVDRNIDLSVNLLDLYNSELELRPGFYFYDRVRDQKFYHLNLGRLQFMQSMSSEGFESYFRYFDLWKIYPQKYKWEHYEYVKKIKDLIPFVQYSNDYLGNLERLLEELNYIELEIFKQGFTISDKRIEEVRGEIVIYIDSFKSDQLKSRIESTDDLGLKIKLTEELVAHKVEIVNANYKPSVFISYARDLGNLAFLNLLSKEYEMAELYARRALEHPNFINLKEYRDKIVDINLTLAWALAMLNEEQMARDIFKNLKAKNTLKDLKTLALTQLESLQKKGIDLSKFDFLLPYFD